MGESLVTGSQPLATAVNTRIGVGFFLSVLLKFLRQRCFIKSIRSSSIAKSTRINPKEKTGRSQKNGQGDVSSRRHIAQMLHGCIGLEGWSYRRQTRCSGCLAVLLGQQNWGKAKQRIKSLQVAGPGYFGALKGAERTRGLTGVCQRLS